MTRNTLLLLVLALHLNQVCPAQLITKKESKSIDKILIQASNRNQPKSYLFKDVTLLTMVDSTLRVGDVLIENGIISRIDSHIDVDGVIVINGKDKYLIPGLVDMHLHIFHSHPMKNTWLLLSLLNGVTSFRDLAGTPKKLKLKAEINANKILGPNIYQSGPIMNAIGRQEGHVIVTNPEKARKQVVKQKNSGYDFIKVYNELSYEVYQAIVDEAKKQDMPVVGHVPDAVPLYEALQHQSTIEHLTGYKEWNGAEAYLSVDDNYAKKTALANTWNCLTLFNMLINWEREKADAISKDSVINKHLPTGIKNHWKNLLSKDVEKKLTLLKNHGENNKTLLVDITLNLYDEGAKLIAGTDAGAMPLLVPGFALIQELITLNKIGIPVYEVLKTATANTALAMRKFNEFGTIEEGKRADLILLNNNPLEDLDHLKNQNGVMVRGIWLDRQELTSISTEIQRAFGNQ